MTTEPTKQLIERFDPKPFRTRPRVALVLVLYVLILTAAVVFFGATTADAAEAPKKTTMVARVPICQEDEVITFAIPASSTAEAPRRTDFRCANFDDLVLNYVIDRATTWDPGLEILLQEAAEAHLDRIAASR